ncbi:hypothetical protein SE17_06735 [Kouleothrix aurantiaca]|uniref:Acyltransferase n=1 Tax=Kouleothrix aurantiaca TaxID=186479 RepID=A0A0N8PSX5_9CHLR|nr:hypothetical protein SE17_06735 [Kouleothrix aurantiaca]
MQSDSPAQLHPSTGYIPQIDSLRAIAVLAVILYQLDPSLLPGGFSGVDVFFVISGYVVSRSLAADGAASFRQFLAGFYARRIVRIVPPLLACLLATSVAATMLIPRSWPSSTSQDTAKYAFIGMSNIALIWSSDDYFSPRAENNAFTHTWSLGVEEQFYLIFPLLFFIWMRWRRRPGAQGIAANALLALLFALSLAYAWYASSAAPTRAFYLLPSRFWELACGALLFQLQSRKDPLFQSSTAALGAGYLGLALLASSLWLSAEQSFPFPGGLLAVGGTALSIAGVQAPQANHSLAVRMLGSRILVWIGKLSYSLYLWHWPVIVLLKWTTGLETPLQMVLALVLTGLLGALSFFLLENPIRHSRLVRTQPRWRVIAAGLASVLLAYVATTNIFAHQSQISLSVTRDARTWNAYAWPNQATQARAQCKTKASFTEPNGGRVTIYEPINCKPQLTQPRQLFVIGDSHAGAYMTMFYTLAEENAFTVKTYSRGGCSAASLMSSLNEQEAECNRFIKAALQDTQQRARAGDLVLLVALNLPRLVDKATVYDEQVLLAAQESDASRAARATALAEADAVLSTFEQQGLRVIMEAPKPVFKAPAFRCFDWFNRNNPICAGGLAMSRDYLLKYRQPIMRSLDTLSAKHPKLIVWDPFPILCPADPCGAADQAGPLFYDGDHLSAHGDRVLYPSFRDLLRQLWAAQA